MFGFSKDFDAQVLMTTMMGAVNDVFNTTCSEKFSDGPTIVTREIGEIDVGKMNVDIDIHYKFYSKSFISVINFFKDNKALERNTTCGFVITYIEQSCLINLFRALGFQKVDPKKTESMLDTCGEFCNMIAGQFKNQLTKAGYINLVMSSPQSRLWAFPEGVDFPEGVKKYHELSFYLFNTKAVVVDVAMANIPHS